MKTRIISGLIMMPLLIFVIIGGPCIKLLGFIIAMMGIKEFYNGFNALDVKPSYRIAAASIILLYLINILQSYTAFAEKFDRGAVVMAWLFVSVLMSLLYLFKIEERRLEDAMATITGIVYVGFFSYHAVMTEDSFATSGKASPVWFILITAFCTDIFAYFGGYFFGKHKLCPVISPKKTIEGAVSGVLASTLFTMLFGYFLFDSSMLVLYVLIGIAGGIISQFGDLTASIFKRKMGIKDYGKLIPGHGGIMDRFDSILFTAPMVYYVMEIVYSIQ